MNVAILVHTVKYREVSPHSHTWDELRLQGYAPSTSPSDQPILSNSDEVINFLQENWNHMLECTSLDLDLNQGEYSDLELNDSVNFDAENEPESPQRNVFIDDETQGTDSKSENDIYLC